MNYDFVDRFNELEIRKGQRHGNCKVCDGEIKDKDIVKDLLHAGFIEPLKKEKKTS